MILRIQLLSDAINEYKRVPRSQNLEFIEKCIIKIREEIKEHRENKEQSDNISEEDLKTFKDICGYVDELKKQNQNILVNPKEKFYQCMLAFRGLLFDIKTRLEYDNPHVAIQDGLDLKEYGMTVVEQLNHDLTLILSHCSVAEIGNLQDELGLFYTSIYPHDQAQLRKTFFFGQNILANFEDIYEQYF